MKKKQGTVMDQTTDTADLTETEKYLNSVLVESGDESDVEEEAHDALLGGIRTGLRIITKNTRESLSTCKNKAELDGAVQDIENSALNLLKLEKSFLKTASIVSGVIDDLVEDFEDPDDLENGNASFSTGISCDINGSGDASIAKADQNPYVFRLSPTNMESVAKFRTKLSKELNKRMDDYKSSLTDSYLKADKKFQTLLDQVKLGRSDAENCSSYTVDATWKGGNEKQDQNCDIRDQAVELHEESDDEAASLSNFLKSIPYTAEELLKHKYKPYDEEADTDDSCLPSVDPITKELIMNPVKNKFCQHVFDKDSIFSYISCTAEPKCPIHMCNNKQILEESHFVTDAALTARIRRKNKF